MVNGRKKGGFERYNVQSMNSGKIVTLSLQHIKLTHLLVRVIFIILNNKLCIYYIDGFQFFFYNRITANTGRGVVLAVFYRIFLRSSRETFVSPHYYFA